MPSWQSYCLNMLVRVQVKRKLAKATTLQAVRKAFGTALPEPNGVKFTPGAVGLVTGEWVESGGIPDGMMLYLHGGGYIACSPATHRPITGAYAKRGLKLFVPDYRLAPEHPFPAALRDALAAYKGLLESGISPLKLAVGGDSAGGGLALAMLLEARAAGLPMPACAMLFSPWTDLAATGESLKTNLQRDPMLHGDKVAGMAAFYLNGADAKNPLASPLYGNLTGFPPLLIQAGETEVLLDDAKRLASAARAAGVSVELKIWANLPHVWQLFQGFLPEAGAALNDASGFAKQHFAA